MTTYPEARIIFYKDAVKEFEKSCLEYQRKNVDSKGLQDVEGIQAPVWTVTTEEALCVIKLKEVIQYASAIDDKKRRTVKMEKEEERFFSGLRLIDNLLKHTDDVDSQMWELILSMPTAFGRINKKNIIFGMKVSFVFGDIKKIKAPISNEKMIGIFNRQKKNYNGTIRDENVVEVVKKLDNLMNKYYLN